MTSIIITLFDIIIIVVVIIADVIYDFHNNYITLQEKVINHSSLMNIHHIEISELFLSSIVC